MLLGIVQNDESIAAIHLLEQNFERLWWGYLNSSYYLEKLLHFSNNN